MKKVLLIVHKFFPEHRAGTEVLTLKVAQELQFRGYQVAVLTANPPDLDARRKTGIVDNDPELSKYEYAGITVYCLNEKARLQENRFANEHYHSYLKRYYKNIFRSFAPNIVHCFHLQNLSTSLIEEAEQNKIPVVYSATDFWLICPIVQLRRPDGSNCKGPSAYAVNCLSCYTPKLLPQKKEFMEAIENRYKSIVEKMKFLPATLVDLITNSSYFTYLVKKLPSAAAATIERPIVLQHFANKLSAITVPTRLMEELFIRNGFNSDLLHYIPYGIDIEPLKEGQNKTSSEDLRIAYIGSLAEHKGPDLLIRAFMQLPPDTKASIKLYGDLNQFPDYGRYLQGLVKADHPLSKKVTFEGTFPNNLIGEIFKGIDILVVPSRWYENTPLVIQSALAAKTPVIAADLGGMSELIKHEVNGLLFEPNKYESLANMLNKLVGNKSVLPQLINNIVPERSVQDMVDELERLYRRCEESK